MPFLLLLLFLLATAPAARAQPFSFALIGDMPYAPADSLKFGRLIDDINAAEPAWVLHLGDFKGGSAPCADAVFEQRRGQLDRFAAPLVLTPGDNDWTDCHRSGSAPLERLARLRQVFFDRPGTSLGRSPMPLETQAADPAYAEFPEHAMWQRGGVLFVSLHVVGSSNGLRPFDGRTDADDAEVERRMQATVAWTRAAFERARREDLAAILFAIQANPRIEEKPGSTARAPFQPFLEALALGTAEYGRPVVLAHGDSHYFRIDRPLLHPVSGKRVEHFTRLEGFGSPDIHWLEVEVDTGRPQVFTARQRLVESNLADHGP